MFLIKLYFNLKELKILSIVLLVWLQLNTILTDNFGDCSSSISFSVRSLDSSSAFVSNNGLKLLTFKKYCTSLKFLRIVY